MPNRKITITLDQGEQDMVRKFRWSAQPWAGIAEKLRTQLATPVRRVATTETCAACGQSARLRDDLTLWDHYSSPGSSMICTNSRTNQYIAAGCTCGTLARDCTCGASMIARAIR